MLNFVSFKNRSDLIQIYLRNLTLTCVRESFTSKRDLEYLGTIIATTTCQVFTIGCECCDLLSSFRDLFM